MKNEDAGLLGGVPCPLCGSTKRKVIASLRERNCITRRCECASCFERFKTYEKLKDQDLISSDFLFATLKRLTIMENSVSALRKSLETALENYK